MSTMKHKRVQIICSVIGAAVGVIGAAVGICTLLFGNGILKSALEQSSVSVSSTQANPVSESLNNNNVQTQTNSSTNAIEKPRSDSVLVDLKGAESGELWGDSDNGRPSYTSAEIAAGSLGNVITFNSVSDTEIGDEKNFVWIKKTNNGGDIWNADTIEVFDGEEYTIRLYVHNNNPLGLDAVAEDVRASISLPLPSSVSTSHNIIGYIDTSNAKPARYWDGVTLTSAEPFYVEFLFETAQYLNNSMGSITLADSVIISGVPLGYSRFDGKIPGGADYYGVLTMNIRVHKSATSRLSMQVRLKGTADWSEKVWANVGDEVEYKIEYKNLTDQRVDNVVIRDALPTNAEYVVGTTVVYNSNHTDGLQLSDNVTTSGINIGSYGAGGNAIICFTAKIVDNTLSKGENQLVNWASATVNDNVFKDDASVFVTKAGD